MLFFSFFSRAVLDADAFMRLRDSIIDEIDDSKSESLAKAREICDRLERRDLYSKYKKHSATFEAIGFV